MEAQQRTTEQVAALVAAWLQTTERVDRLESAVTVLAEAQRNTDQRVTELAEAQRCTEERLAMLAEPQRHMEERLARLETIVEALIQRVDRLEQIVQALIQRVDRIDTQVADLRGDNLERRYREHVGACFGPWLRRVRALTDYDLGNLLEEAEDRGRLSARETVDVRAADLVVHGRRRSDGQELYLVVEVSAGVRQEDIERAVRRARLFGRALGTPEAVVAAAAGEYIDPEARSLAVAQGVWVTIDGRERSQGG